MTKAFFFVLVPFLVVQRQPTVSALKIVTIGDWGDSAASGIANQAIVAATLNDWCGREECQFIVSTGDNFYPQGVTGVDDSRFDTSWRWVYNHTNIETKQWMMSIGNHDHDNPIQNDGREINQVWFGQTETRWYFPWLWYDLHYTDDVTKLHLVVIDTESLLFNQNNPDVQLDWLNETLAQSKTDDWTIVVAHHPPYASGNYGPTNPIIANQVVPLCLKYGVDVFLSGHDHNLQHITQMENRTMDYVISGGGGRGLYSYNPTREELLNQLGFQLDFFGYTHGFIAFDFTPTTMLVEYVDKEGDVIYTINRSR